jgi:hypothetical protein
MRIVTALVAACLMSGCLMLSQKKIGKRPQPVQIASCTEKPDIAIRLTFDSDDLLLGKGIELARLEKATKKVAGEAAPCFRSIAVDPPAEATATLHVNFHLQLHNNASKEFVVGFVSGFTAFTIPTWCTFPFTVTYRIFDAPQNEILSVQLEDSYRLYQHLLLLPATYTVFTTANPFYENFVRAFFSDTDWDAVVTQARKNAAAQ